MKYLIFCLMVMAGGLACTSPAQVGAVRNLDADLITIEAEHIQAPVFMRENHNPLFRIRIAIPGIEAVRFSDLVLNLDGNATRYLDSIRLYLTDNTGSTDFKNMTYIGTTDRIFPSSTIRFDRMLNPGVHNLWVTASVKPGSDIDDQLSVRPTYLEINDRNVNITRQKNESAHRIGIALKQRWDDNIHTYRIPGIAETGRGTLLAVYDNRYTTSSDLPGNIDVGLSRSTDGGQTWEPMKVIMDMGAPHENNGIGDPAILYDKFTNTIWVAALWSKGNNSIRDSRPGLSPDSSGQFVLVSSKDDGVTWSEPMNITSQVKNPKWHIYFNGPGNGSAMEDGTLVFASQYWDENKIPHSSIIYSKDKGATWKSGTGAKSNTTEAQVIETRPGTLMLNMRDNRGRFRSVATTIDMGKTWTEHASSYEALIDPVCMASLIKMNTNSVRNILFFSNVNDMHARKNMSIKYSRDLGLTWSDGLLIDERPTFGYSALTPVGNTHLGLLYEGFGNLYYVRVPVSAITGTTINTQ